VSAAAHGQKRRQIIRFDIPLPYPQKDLLGDAPFTQPHSLYRHFVGVLLHQPARQCGGTPSCGLKIRSWDEVIPALQNMVSRRKRCDRVV